MLRHHVVLLITFMATSRHSRHPLLLSRLHIGPPPPPAAKRPRFFLALDPSYVPPRSVVIASIAIVPIEEYGNQIGRHIVPAIGGIGEIIEASPRAMIFHE